MSYASRRFDRLVVALAVLVGLLQATAVGAAQDDSRLDRLFAELRQAEEPDEGERIGREIASIWIQSGREDVDLLMTEGQRFKAERNLHFAADRFRRITVLAPDFAEGWNKLGHVHYLLGDLDTAIGYVRRALELEPRHFLALAGLGAIYLDLGRGDLALEALQRALALNPHLAGARRWVDELRRRLEGRGI